MLSSCSDFRKAVGQEKIIPDEWRQYPQFAGIDQLEAVPVATVQLRYNGWVTELENDEMMNFFFSLRSC